MIKPRLDLVLRLISEGKLEQALETCLTFKHYFPARPEFSFYAGKIAFYLDNYSLVVKELKHAIAIDENYYESQLYIAYAYEHLEQNSLAIEHYQRTIFLKPDCSPAYDHLIGLLLKLTRLEEAKQMVLRAQEFFEDFRFFNYAGVIYTRLKQYSLALNAYKQALALKPDTPLVLNNLGHLWMSLKENSLAINCFQSAMSEFSEDPLAYRNMGLLLIQHTPRIQEALFYFKEAFSRAPGSEEILRFLGETYEMIGDHERAFNYYQQAFDIEQFSFLKVKQALLFPMIAKNKEELEQGMTLYQEKIEGLFNYSLSLSDLVSNTHGMSLYPAYTGLNCRQTHQYLASVYLSRCSELRFVAPHCLSPIASKQRIKLGIISSYLLPKHSIGKYFRRLLLMINPQEFDLTLFHFGQIDHALKVQLDCVQLSSDICLARQEVASFELDIIVYPEISLDAKSYFLAYSRLAPVQCVTWGQGVTTGIPTIDYYISFQYFVLEGAQDYYSEYLILMEHLLAYYAKPEIRQLKPRSYFNLKEDRPLYLCVQNLFKISPEFDEIIANILLRDPLAQIIFIRSEYDEIKQILEQRLRQSIVAGIERIQFIERQNQEDFLNLIACADVILDTMTNSGGISSYDALAIGTPIMTYPNTLASSGRMTAAYYHYMGFNECIASSPEDYVQKSIRLANDSAYNQKCTRAILDSHDILYNNILAVREFEVLLKGLLSSYCQET